MPNFYIVDVKHGNSAVLIDTKGVVIIDAGTRSRVLDFLLEKNITQVDVLLLSHADNDHVGGAMALLKSELVIKEIYANPDASKNSDIWDDLIWTLYDLDKKNEIKFSNEKITPDLTGKLDQGEVNIEILAPNKYIATKGSGSKDRNENKLTTNSISAVIRFIYQNKPIVLLPGDIDQIGLDNLLQDSNDISAWLLVFPHHGGHSGKDITGFTTQICQAVKPEKIIFSIGDNKNKFPLKEVIETISLTLQNTSMYTTNHSDIFQSHIIQYPNSHKNNVGHIHLDFTQAALELKFYR